MREFTVKKRNYKTLSTTKQFSSNLTVSIHNSHSPIFKSRILKRSTLFCQSTVHYDI